MVLISSSASGGTSTPKFMIANVSPGSIAAGATTAQTFTLTNCAGSPCDSRYTSQQSLGSANVTAPYPISSLDSVSGGIAPCPVPLPNGGQPCATLASATSIQLRNLNLAPGASVSVGFHATAPCSGGPYAWSVVAKQANQFNGTGNDFQLVTPSALTTTLSGACTLAFVDQPAAAVVNSTITSSAYNPSAGPVTVEVLDGTGDPLTTGTFSITIGLGTCTDSPDNPTSLLGCGKGNLASASNTFTRNTSTSSGIVEASFADLSIDDIGGYRLGASAGTLPESSNATSDFFTIAQKGMVCTPETQDCMLDNSNTTTGTTLDVGTTVNGGTLSLSLIKNAPLTCGAYKVVHGSASVADIHGSDFAGGTITLTTSHSAAPGTGVGGFTICLASILPFTTADGTDAHHVGNFYVGTLPNCSPKVQAPCIVSKNRSVPSSDLIITFRIAPRDPMWYD